MKQFGGIERDLSGRFLIVVGGPRMVVKGGPLGKAKWLKWLLEANMGGQGHRNCLFY